MSHFDPYNKGIDDVTPIGATIAGILLVGTIGMVVRYIVFHWQQF